MSRSKPFPYEPPTTHTSLVNRKAHSWERPPGAKIYVITTMLLLIGAALAATAFALDVIPAVICGVFAGLAILFGILLLLTIVSPEGLTAVYEDGIARYQKDGTEVSTIPWSSVKKFRTQEFYSSRFSEMQLLYEIHLKEGKPTGFNSNAAGDPKGCAEWIKANCTNEYETWDEVLARTG